MIRKVQGEFKDARGNLIEFDLHFDFSNNEIVAYRKLIRNHSIRLYPNDTILADLKKHIHANMT